MVGASIRLKRKRVCNVDGPMIIPGSIASCAEACGGQTDEVNSARLSKRWGAPSSFKFACGASHGLIDETVPRFPAKNEKS